MKQIFSRSILAGLVLTTSLNSFAGAITFSTSCTRTSNMNQTSSVRTETKEMNFRVNFQAASTRIELLFADNNLDEVLLANEAPAIRGHDDRAEFLAGSSVRTIGSTRETSLVSISENYFVATLRQEISASNGRLVQAQDIRCKLSEEQWDLLSATHRSSIVGDAVPFHNGASTPALFAELRK